MDAEDLSPSDRWRLLSLEAAAAKCLTFPPLPFFLQTRLGFRDFDFGFRDLNFGFRDLNFLGAENFSEKFGPRNFLGTQRLKFPQVEPCLVVRFPTGPLFIELSLKLPRLYT